jgi:hypothetical protein
MEEREVQQAARRRIQDTPRSERHGVREGRSGNGGTCVVLLARMVLCIAPAVTHVLLRSLRESVARFRQRMAVSRAQLTSSPSDCGGWGACLTGGVASLHAPAIDGQTFGLEGIVAVRGVVQRAGVGHAHTLRMRGSVKMSNASRLVELNSLMTAPSSPLWNQWRVLGGMVYWSPGRSSISWKTV